MLKLSFLTALKWLALVYNIHFGAIRVFTLLFQSILLRFKYVKENMFKQVIINHQSLQFL